MSATTRLTDRKRADILEAAIAVFGEQGFENASMDSISQRASVSKRTVYNHFPSKDLLFGEIVRQLQEKASDVGAFTYDPGVCLGEQLEKFCVRAVDLYRNPDLRILGRIVISRFIQTPKLGREMMENGKVFEVRLTEWISCAIANGALRECDPGIAARQLLSMLEGFFFWPQLILNEEEPSLEEMFKIARSTIEMFLGHYGVAAVKVVKP